MALYRKVGEELILLSDAEEAANTLLHRTVGGFSVLLSDAEDTATRAEWAANDAAQITAERQAKINKLIVYEKNQALEAQISARRTAIEAMNDPALDAAIAAAGI